jgi:misacylated tRNA(Ala) deacylase
MVLTTAYTRAGGELNDRGIMSWNNRQDEGNVIAMNKRDEVVWHTLDCHPPPLGTEVVGTSIGNSVTE